MLPTLTYHLSKSILDSSSDTLAYLLRHYLTIPHGLYENFLDYEYSLAYRIAESNNNPDHLKDLVKQDLEDYFYNTFDNTKGDRVIVDVTTNDIDEKNYELHIDVMCILGENNKQYHISNNIVVNKDSNSYTINFEDNT